MLFFFFFLPTSRLSYGNSSLSYMILFSLCIVSFNIEYSVIFPIEKILPFVSWGSYLESYLSHFSSSFYRKSPWKSYLYLSPISLWLFIKFTSVRLLSLAFHYNIFVNIFDVLSVSKWNSQYSVPILLHLPAALDTNWKFDLSWNHFFTWLSGYHTFLVFLLNWLCFSQSALLASHCFSNL